jgi:fibronectin type 3 domain-containing protein
MKRLFISCVVLHCCLSVSFAQGIQGNVKFSGKATVVVTGHSVALTWTASQNATSYDIYRGTAQGGPYVRLASEIVGTTYTDIKTTHNQTLYYVTTAVSGTSESGYSNEAVAVIP